MATAQRLRSIVTGKTPNVDHERVMHPSTSEAAHLASLGYEQGEWCFC